MNDTVLVDTGPLVAFLNRRDRHHRWALEQLSEITPPVLTCEPVLTEACFLLRETPQGPAAVLEHVDRGAIEIAYDLEREAKVLARLITRYADTPMSLADACLVRMVELRPGAAVLTLDRDFRVYRTHGRRVIPTIMPSDL